MKNAVRILCCAALLAQPVPLLFAQTGAGSDLRVNLSENGSRYISATFAGQVWLRYNQSNPGTTVNGFDQPETFDIGLRRVRMQVFGKIHERVFLYSQFGINNFGYNSARKPGLFFHDVLGEYYITPRSLQVGAGLTAWTGFARYSSPAVASILGYDAPLYQQSTNDVNDQFLRKLSVYAKGKIGRLDYRLVLSNPMLIDAANTAVKPISVYSDFSLRPPRWQISGYLMYQFLDEESNLTPYTAGNYLGKKKVFNIGAGFQFQPQAMWRHADAVNRDTLTSDLLNVAADLFYDHPLGTKGASLTWYLAASRTDYGKNYIRNLGVMNPGSGGTSLNEGGSAYPMYGTGNMLFTQAGFLLPQGVLGEKAGQLQPFGELTLADFERLNNRMVLWGGGCNWLIDGTRAKISLGYQNRPVFDAVSLKESSRRNMLLVQLQVAI